MKSIFKTAVLVVTLAFTAVSCSSDDDNNSEPVTASRDVKYEITGNFTGKLDATYMEKSGAPLIEDVTSLPWTKEFTANADSNGALVHSSGYGGVAGQTVTAKIYVGGKVVSELTGTANSDGIIVVHPNTYVFPR
ncbi:MmpS family transport accessory protein [Flavobacterium sp. MMLR14_040]|uniref:MmpS family transport accessory protein n=1 Tax=Flavobacterium sp. MMLR14_040 TaxID=3093843 RepID=UPI002990536D|nr:MmpS family transport accessory protein [Flavobacterium sp. MMLR14_040]MDW8851478.1 MmpS family transport accessory protein [Flavobacterium sp. MMLR14_040]